MKPWKSVIAAAVLALAYSTAAMAARTDLVLGMPLEPPHLDPTAGAAAAIDEVLYANVFEGLTRIGHLHDCIAYGPGILDLAHRPDEWVGIDDMVQSAKVMAVGLDRLLRGKGRD